MAIVGFVAEGADDAVDEIPNDRLLRHDRHRARLDLGEVENVGDEVEQVRASAVNRLRKLDLLA